MTKTTINIEKDSRRNLGILSAVKGVSISDVINYLIERDPESKKILEVTKQ